MADLPPVAPIMVDGHGQSGGYKFSAEAVDGIIKRWEDVLADTKKDRELAYRIANVQAPAQEFASTGFIEQHARPTGQSLVAQLNEMIKYIQNYLTALNAAKNKITVAEQQARDAATAKTGF